MTPLPGSARDLTDHSRQRLAGRILARIKRRYHTVSTELTVGELTIPFVRLADPDVVLDQVAAEEDRLEKISGRRADSDQLHLPYWAELWDSAAGIAAALSSSDRTTAQLLSVLDLGCGMGLAGTVAARLGMR